MLIHKVAWLKFDNNEIILRVLCSRMLNFRMINLAEGREENKKIRSMIKQEKSGMVLPLKLEFAEHVRASASSLTQR